MTDVLVAGHVCVDLAPRFEREAQIRPGALFDVGALEVRVGGCIANTGAVLAALGSGVRAHGLVGDDELGAIAAAQLGAREGITADLAVDGSRATSYSIVIQPPGRDRTFWHHTGANDAFDGESVRPGDARLVHVGYPPLLPGIADRGGAPLERLMARVKASGATTSLDLAVVDPASRAGGYDWRAVLRRALPHVDVLTPSLDDLTSALRIEPRPGLADDLAGELIAGGAAVVAISDGERGLLLRTAPGRRLRQGGPVLAPLADEWGDVRVRLPPIAVAEPRTTNGAGDAATAGLLHGMLVGADPAGAAACAIASAAAWIERDELSPSALVGRDARLAAWMG
ncbi:carbohydrate kinase family protein [Microbacterium sp. Marseille-Q6965]|uniref:carbohydrate kinase family protein n=1 Tax=Microbacterium sp. Marseille-Q6965 TaxID=2965072 RepID=UPI0021B7656F|nr:carbohydrate kinase family protein [Microbacterium sp. Marseille-Q6965]